MFLCISIARCFDLMQVNLRNASNLKTVLGPVRSCCDCAVIVRVWCSANAGGVRPEHRRKQGTWEHVQLKFKNFSVTAGWGKKMATDLVRTKGSLNPSQGS